MKRLLLGSIGLVLLATTLVAASGEQILLVARDLVGHPLPGLRFSFDQVKSRKTNSSGITELDLPPKRPPGQQIKINLVSASKRSPDWFLVNPQINIPTDSDPAEIVLMSRSAFRQIAAEARDASRQGVSSQAELTMEERKRVLVEAAARHGLTAGQLETALRSFAETQDPKDKGIAAYLKGEFSQAEVLLSKAAEKKESDFIETLEYLGASQYEQANYHAAADTFRKAVALRGEDGGLINWLGLDLYKLAEWTEAESLLRRALAIDQKNFGPNHADVARDLNNLTQVLQATNHLAEAEPLMRRVIEICESSPGEDYPNLGTAVNNLARLLHDTNRLSEAEPLMRRALAMDEKRLGPDHPNVGRDLNNISAMLQDMNRFAEAEPLIRRALVIDEKHFGPDHPKVAVDINNLSQLLRATNRLAEAEILMRRVIVIFENSLGKDHPNVAVGLNNLADLLQTTNRLVEAEPLLRRALTIDEKSFGQEHPNVAIVLNNLAQLLQDSNRLAEAEPFMRRALAIDEKSFGQDHPSVATDLNNLAQLVQATNRLDEAEPLLRRALAINEKSFGAETPNTATTLILNNLALLLQNTNNLSLLQATSRLAEADLLVRRALTMDEKSLGPDHPDVARDLNNLAWLLQARGQLAEAEPLMRRALAIFLSFERRTGHEHVFGETTSNNYRRLLKEMGKTDTEIEAAIEGLGRSK